MGSTSMFINVVNAIVAGTLGALVAGAAGGPAWVIATIGAASGVTYLGVLIAVARRTFSGDAVQSRFPTPKA